MFRCDGERFDFLELLAGFDERFRTEIHAFCLMGNHFHLLVRSAGGDLPASMQWLSGLFTRAVNRRRQVDGPVFRGRYHSVPVTDERHLFVVGRYIHRNPMDIDGVDDLRRYPWSSYGPYLGRDRLGVGAWLHTSVLRTPWQNDADHREFVEGTSDPNTDRSTRSPRHVDEIEAALVCANGIDGVVKRSAVVRDTAIALAIDDYDLARSDVASTFRLEAPTLRSALGRGRRLVADPSAAMWIAAASEMIGSGVRVGV